MSHIREENAYCEAQTERLKPLQVELFEEMLSHLKETDEEVGERIFILFFVIWEIFYILHFQLFCSYYAVVWATERCESNDIVEKCFACVCLSRCVSVYVYCIELCCVVLCCIVLCCLILLCCTVLYCIVLYCIILYCVGHTLVCIWVFCYFYAAKILSYFHFNPIITL